MKTITEQLQIGRYQVFSQAGADYSGASYLARDTEQNQVVRVKVYRPEYRHDPAFAANFRKDLPRARKPGNDAYIAQPLAWGYAQRIYPYVIFNQLVGKTWADLVAVRDMSNADMMELSAQATRALAAAHAEGLVAGELTPQKLVVSRSGGNDEVRLAELALGHPKLLDLKRPNEENGLKVGSLALSEYSAPELAADHEPTAASDVYAMGALLWELFTGMRFRDAWVQTAAPKPAPAKSTNGAKPDPPTRSLKLPHNMPAPLSAFLQHALAPEPSKRFADGGAMYEELAAMQSRERSQKARGNPLSLTSTGETSNWMRRQVREERRQAMRRRLGSLFAVAALITVFAMAFIYRADIGAFVGGWFPGNPTPAPQAAATPAGVAVIGEVPTATPTPATVTSTRSVISATLTPIPTTPTPAPLVVAPAASGVAAQYAVSLTLDLSQPTVPAAQVISYTSQQTTTIAALVFRVVPHHYEGGFTLDHITVNGQSVSYTWLDEVNLSVPLTQTGLSPLVAGGSDVVAMQYTLRPLAAGNRFALDAANHIITLGDWLPTLVPYTYGNAVAFPYARVGDNGIAAPADYRVQVHTVQPLVIAASGQQVAHSGNDWQFNVTAGRDFALTASDKFADPAADPTLTRTAKDGTVIYGYFLPEHRPRATRILDLSVAAYDWYSNRLGDRKVTRFSVAEMADSLLPPANATITATADLNQSITSDQEYPDLYLLRSGAVVDEEAKDGGLLWWQALHGPAYQWFYADLATNQYSDAWLDEATTNYATLTLIAYNYPDSFTQAWQDWGNYLPSPTANPNLRPTPSPDSYKPLGAAVNAFAGRNDYFNYIYRQGATFFRAVRTTMGDDNFWQAMAAYHAQFRGKLATGRDLLTALQAAAPTDLQPLFQQYVGYGSK